MKKLFLDIRAANEFRKSEVITKLTTQYFHSSSSLSQKRHITITDKNNKRYAAVGQVLFLFPLQLMIKISLSHLTLLNP